MSRLPRTCAALTVAALLAAAPAVRAEPRLQELSRLVLRNADARFGGLSGLAVRSDGNAWMALGDRGILVRGAILREGERMTGATVETIAPVLDTKGQPVTGQLADSEGLTMDGSGGWYVSFEGRARIWHYAGPGAPATAVPPAAAFGRLQTNSGLEALAGDASALYAIPERSGKMERPFPVYRFRDGTWDEVLKVPRRGAYLVTGADIGPDGRLYVLERDFAFIGFRSRVRSFMLGEDALTDERELMESSLGEYDNLEGISTWATATGQVRVLLVADDNLSLLQETELIEFALVDE
ncbi:esterase-like activity of phytase family protein [Oceanicella sp. SM1341]|uniref:esterase-like activity of phytase family protein n=1 Tax=Oceanicella sp. SM1341 TaxID=1548889 RepID=UPI001300B9BA|nr:esterase-like activity of phytase family protein [Oceanicella sp. SM1341]